jgi:hypothetical protein
MFDSNIVQNDFIYQTGGSTVVLVRRKECPEGPPPGLLEKK